MPPAPFPRRPLVEELEPRLLFSADFAPALAENLAQQTEQRIIGTTGEFSGALNSEQQAQHARLEVVFIDLRVEGYQQILADIHEQNTTGRSIEVVLLDAERDGVAQIGEFLSQRQDIDAVHIISHGSAGTLELGASQLDFESLLQNASFIKKWGNALADEADILIYGCDLASTEQGQSLVDALSRLTGADVAASEDLTGNAELGGNWLLEYQVGQIETATALDAGGHFQWQGVLDNAPPVNTVPGTQTVNEDTPLTFSIENGNVISIADPDAGSNPVQVTLTATNGTVTLSETVGPEFRVNTTTAGNQKAPEIAVAADGSYVVVWQSQNVDGNGDGIVLQRYDANGAPLGGEVVVNTTILNNQTKPAIAMADDGSFVVVWESKAQDNLDGKIGIYGQRFSAAGAKVGGEFLVNTTTLDDQKAPSIAMDATGNFVVAWQSKAQDVPAETTKWGVFAQRFNAAAVKQGGEFQVNVTTLDDQIAPSVSMSSSGAFVVAWQSKGQDNADSKNGIYARLYNAAGTAQTGEVLVNQNTLGDQRAPAVAMDDSGKFVVAWQSNGQDGSREGIYARRFSAAGTALANEFLVNSTVINDQKVPAIAITATGEFAIAWQSKNQDGDAEGIFVKSYDASGAVTRAEMQVNTSTAQAQRVPAIGLDAAGGAVVVWTSNRQDGANEGVYGQRLLAPGAITYLVGDGTQDAVLTIRGTIDNLNAALDGLVFEPTANFSGTATLQISTNDLGNTGTGGPLSDTDSVTITVLPVNDPPRNLIPPQQTATEGTPLVFSTAGGNAISVSDDAAPGDLLQVSLTAGNGTLTLGTTTGLSFTTGDGVADASLVFTGTLANINAALDGMSFLSNGAFTGLTSIRIATDDLGNTGSGAAGQDSDSVLIDVVPNGLNAAPVITVPGTQTNVANTTVVFGGATAIIVTDDSASSPVTLTLTATNGTVNLNTKTGSETLVNTATLAEQRYSQVAMAPDGGYVIVWQSKGQDNVDGREGIYAQRFDAFGQALGTEFQVNTTTLDNQTIPAVAMDAAGNFVVVWDSNLQDGENGGIFGQRFDAGGARVGTEFQVNTEVINDQTAPVVAMDDSGRFVVAWQGKAQDNADGKYGIYAQLYDASGIEVGDEFQVNTATLDDQTAPAVAMDADGDFVIAWQSKAQDLPAETTKWGIYAQRYNASGVAQGAEFLVNVTTTNDQTAPAVAMDDAGNFVVAWTSNGQDGGGTGIYARRFAANGTALSGEIAANTTTLNSQLDPTIAMDADGDFIIGWQSASQDGSGAGVYAQRFNANGSINGSEFRVNTTTANDQTAPAVAMSASGEIVFTWTSKAQDNADGREGVYAQRLPKNNALTYTTGDGIADPVIVVSGSVADLNKALNGATFSPTTGFTGTAHLAVDVNDQGYTGSGGIKTASAGVDLIYNYAVEKSGLWLSAVNNATTSAGSGTLSFNDGQIARLTDPNLALGAGATAGTFTQVFDIDAFALDGNARIVGLHRVGQSVTVGTTNAVTLQKGDILFTVDGNETLGGVAVTTQNVVLFRPTTLNDYSAGSFSVLVTNPGNTSNSIRDFALVEQAVTVGGTVLQAGDFLLTLSSAAYELDIQLFRPTTMATSPTGGTLSELIDGTSAGIGFGQKIYGLELVQQNTTLGGQALTAGQILVAVNGSDLVGINNLSVTAYDVFALTVTATGTGTSSASAAMLLRGADIALASGGEEIDAIAFVGPNTAPTLADTAMAMTIGEDAGPPAGAAGSLVSAFTGGIADVDSGASRGIAITASNETNGTWYYSLNNGASWTTVGTVNAAQSLLLADNASTRLYFAPAANFSGSSTAALTIRAWDQTSGSAGTKVDTSSNGGATAFSSASDVVDVTVTAVNDAPVVTTSSSSLTYAKDQPATPVDAGLIVSDVDNTLITGATVAISANYNNGQDVLAFTNQLGITGSWSAATGVLTLSGTTTLANYQTALRAVTYINTSGTPNTATRTVSFQANDGTANSVAALRNIEVTSREVNGLWLSSVNNTTTSAGTGGLTYNDGQVARLTDPNLVLGNGTSNGTFSRVFDIDAFTADGNAGMAGLHYVSRAVTVGTTNPVTLQAGDILLTTDGNETLGGVAVTTRNIVLFRPTTPGNYSAGTFSILLTNPGNTGANIRDFALVETAMTVGGTALQAGDFLLTMSGGANDTDVQLFRPTTMATNPTGGSLSDLIDGDGSTGIGFNQQIYGLELVQQATLLGNTLLNQGQLLIALKGTDSAVGSNNLSVTAFDIFALTVNATGAGTSSAVASMLLRGADVGLTAGGEEIDAIALANAYNTPVNVAPVLSLPSGTLNYIEKEPAKLVDPAATVTDTDSANFDTGKLVVDLATTGTINDRLGIRNEGGAAGQIGVSGDNVTYGGVVIGTWTGGTDGFTPLVVSFNANATPAAVQALARNLTYSNISTNPATTPRTLQMALSDGDGSTSATASKAITVTAVEDFGLWLSSINTATTSAGTGGLTFNDGQVVRLTDPNLALGSGTSNGTFSQVFDIDAFAADGNASIAGLHYVSRTVTVGTTNPFTLRAGDVLLAVDANETLGGVAVTTKNIVLFRPTALGSYTSGTFSILITNPGNTGNNIREFALVENAMTVGGTALQAGDFLLTLSSATYDKDISLFRPTTMGTNPTGGTLTELVDGASAGIGFGQQVFGLELVQRNMVLGGQFLQAGQILVALNGNDVVGTNNLSVKDYDVFALALTATGTSTSSAAASMLMRGADVGLSAGGEEIDAIGLVPVNSAPSLDSSKNPALNAQNEDSGMPVGAVGTLVSQLVDFAIPAGQLDNVSDPDAGPLLGIAITAADTAIGAWWYSIDGGTNWNALGAVSDASAQLLAADAITRIYFQPNANWNGTLANALTFRAWDRTSGTNGGMADTSSSTSTLFDQFTSPAYTNNDGTAFWSTPWVESDAAGGGATGGNIQIVGGQGQIITNNITDSIHREANLSGAASASLSFDYANALTSGNQIDLQVSSNGGLTWTTLATFSASSNTGSGSKNFNISAYMASNTQIRFQEISRSGSATLSFDNVQISYVVSKSGGASAFSSNTDSALLTVNPVNDAPLRTAGTVNNLTVLEDAAATSLGLGSLAYGPGGGADESAQTFTYTVTAVPAAALGNITLADGVTVVTANTSYTLAQMQGMMFKAAANASSGPATFSWKVVDSGGTANGGVDTLNESLTVTVTPVNDQPVRTAGTGNNLAVPEDAAATSLGLAGLAYGPGGGADESGQTFTYTVTAVPAAALGNITLADGVTVVTANTSYTLAQLQGMMFLASANANGGPASFSWKVQDSGGTANGGLDTLSESLSITVNPVNDAPAGTDKSVTTLEDTAYTFTTADFGFTDASDSPANALANVKITALPAAGSLTLNGVAVAAGQFVSVANINAGPLRFTPAANANGAGHASLTFQVQDDGGIANGGVDLDPSANTITIDVTAVNDAPAGTNKTVTTFEDTAYTFTATDFGFTDPGDSPGNALALVKITTLPLAGALTLNGIAVTAGQSVTAAEISGGLLRFTPAANANGAGYASFTFQVQDDGGTANGGVDLDPTANTITIDVTPVNDAPLLSGANDLPGLYEDPAANSGSLVSALIAGWVSDVDAGAVAGIAVTAADNSQGIWQFSTDGGGLWTAFGSPDAATARLLATDANTYVRFVPNANWNGTANLTFRAWDQTSGVSGGVADTTVNGDTTAYSTATASSSIVVTAVNDAPSGTDRTVSTSEDSAYIFTLADFGFADPQDSPANALLAVKITTLPTAGTLTNNGVALVAGQFVSVADIAAGRLVFNPAANANGAGYASFGFQVQDNGGTADGGADLDATANALTVNLTAVNDAPINTAPTSQSLARNATLVFSAANGNAISVSDIDAGAGSLQVTLTASNGSLSLSGVAGLSFTAGDGVADATMTFSGTAAAINAALNGMSYTPTAGFTGVASLQIATSDLGNSGAGGALSDTDTVALNVLIPGPASMWLTTNKGATALGGVTWSDGELVNFGDPNLAFEPGTTSGTFTPLFNIDSFSAGANNNISALYRVGSSITVGSGANTRTLQAGDILLSVTNADTLGGVSVNSKQLLLFRPVAPDDYSSGTFSILLDNITGNDIREVALVETPLTVGGVNLNAGDFLLVQGSGGYDKDIWRYQATGVGSGTTSGTLTEFIDGQDINLSQQIGGMELVQQTVVLGDVTLQAGQILLSLRANDATVGSNSIAVTRHDIFKLDVSQAGATTVANASMLFQGADVGLSSGGEELDGIALRITNHAPVLAGANNLTAIDEDAPVNGGTLVSSLIAGQLSDADASALTGIAVTAVNNSNGTWQYSLNGGTSWSNFGAVSTTSARLLAADAGTYVRFVPNANWNGTVTAGLSFFAWDQTAGVVGGVADASFRGGATAFSLASASSSITVNPVNDAPQAAGDAFSTAEDTPLSATVLTNDTDVEGNPLFAILVSGPSHGTVLLNADGTFTYTPDANYFGSDSFTYKINDGVLDSPLASVSIAISPVNDAPVGTNDNFNGLEDQAISGNVLANDSDVEGNPLTAVLISGPAHGSLSLNAAGSFFYTPDADWNGSDSFTYQASDGSADSNLVTVTLSVAPVNDAPVSAGDTYVTPEDTALAGNVLSDDSDADGNPLTAILVSGPAHGSLTLNADGSFSYTPDLDYAGPDGFSYRAFDGTAYSNIAQVTIAVAAVNDPPVSVADGFATNEDTVLAGNVLTNDTDVDGNPLTAILVSGPAHGSLTLNADGSFSYTPDANYNGADSFTYQASDGLATGNIATVSVTVNPVNDAPVANPDAYSMAEDISLAGNVLDDDVDVEGSPLSAALVAGVAHGTLAFNADGSFTYTPDADWNGSDSFTYQASDGLLQSNVVTVTISVDPVNDAPLAVNDVVATDEDTALAGNVLANDSDIENDVLAVTLVTGPSHGSLVLNADGSFTYTPDADWSGSDSFTYQAHDAGADSNLATVSITVNAVNDPPSTTPVTLAAIAEDSGTRLITQAELLATASDVEGDALTASGLSITAGVGSLVDNLDGTWTYTPALNDDGAVSFSYTVSDGVLSVAGSATLDILPVNDTPVVNPVDLGNLDEDGNLLILQADLLAGASDLDGDALFVTSVTLASGPGSVVDNYDGTWTYTPPGDFHGPVSFDFVVTDTVVNVSSTATLVVTAIADITNDSLTTDEDTPITANVISGTNGASADSFEGAPLLTAVSQGANGTVTFDAAGNVTYTPDANWHGSDAFSYTVTSGGVTETATVSVTVNPVNDAPVIVANTLSITEGDTVVLDNTNLNTSDIEQGPAQLTYTVSNITHGQFEWAALPGVAITSFSQDDIDAGLVVFVHDASDIAPSYDVTVNDGTTPTGPQPATINFTPVSEGINIFALSGATTTEAGGTVTFDVTLNSQPFTDVTVFIVSGNPAEGTASVSSLTFTSADWNAAQQVTVTGMNDFVVDGDQNYAIQLQAASADRNYDALAAPDVALINLDDDSAGIMITPTSGLTTDEAGASDSFSVVLTSQPLADVSIDLSSSNLAEGVLSDSTLLFTPADWNIPQVVTVTGIDDALKDGDIAYQAIAAPASSADPLYNGMAGGSVDILNLDVADPMLIDPPVTDPVLPPDGEAGAPEAPEESPSDSDKGGTGQLTPLPGFSTDFNDDNTVDSAPDVSLKSWASLLFKNEIKPREVLTDPDTQGNIFLRLLEIIQVEHVMDDAGQNRISPAIHIEINPEEKFQVEILSQGAQITAVSLSVGAIWWALRAGGLFTSLLTSLPAWGSFDVLPVLKRDEEGDEDKDPWGFDEKPEEDEENKAKSNEELAS